MRIQYQYTQIQSEDGARDVRVLKLTPVTLPTIANFDNRVEIFDKSNRFLKKFQFRFY